ncbi:MAG: hypothetical protein BWY87_01067 [Deltaproteobacteria bacterium ADurb.Bin510]|nr:MAG: hypothetical protein BWY87_01067 [Deltaproteobacteria bacterium ADurb.Bin510]
MNVQSVNSASLYAQLNAKPETGNAKAEAKPVQDEQLARIQQTAAAEEKKESPKTEQAEQEKAATGGSGRIDLYA